VNDSVKALGVFALVVGCGACSDAADGGAQAGRSSQEGGGAGGSSSSGLGQSGSVRNEDGSSGSASAQGGSSGLGGTVNPDGANAGGSANAGGAGHGGSAGVGGGMSGRGDAGTACAQNSALPASAPTLTPGVWVNVSPPSVPFNTYDNSGQPIAFAQGLTLDPCDVGTLYLSVQANDAFPAGTGIYKTTNAGGSWQKVSLLDGPLHVKVDPRNPLHLYASDDVRGDHIGFWISKDGGQTFTQPDSFVTAANTVCNNHAYYIGVDPADFDHLLVSFHGSWCNDTTTGFFESKDGGTTFTVHQSGGWMGGEGRAVFFLHDPDLGLGNDQTWLCATQSSGHWVTTNGGANWKQATTINTDHGGNQLYYTANGTLYAGGNPNLMRSVDNGQTWTALTFGGFLSVIGDGVNLYTGTHGGGTFITAKESDDTHWTAFDSQTFAEGPFEMAFDAANGIVYSSNIRGGVWALKVKR
jgi:hypothetical protein